MDTSRRALLKTLSVGASALAASGQTINASAPQAVIPRAEMGDASALEGELAIVNFDLLETAAQRILSPGRFAFLGPAGDGWTYRENRLAFNHYPILPRRLQGISPPQIDVQVSILGQRLATPILTCPIGAQGMYHTRAEVATAAGTAMAGTLFCASGAAHRSIEEIATASTGPKWFQIYMNRDMGINQWLCQRAKAAGFSAIVLTADALGPGQSDEYRRLGSPPAPGETQGNHDPARGGRGTFADQKRDLRFSDISFLRDASGLPVIVKGVGHPEDVRQALAAGAAAIWVSNHGGRQLDGVPASVSMLAPTADVVAGRVPIIFDSGIRRGIDVFKALALGATVVGIGRPVLWGLTCGGAAGVNSVYGHLLRELRETMLLAGVTRASDIKRDHLQTRTG